MLDFDKIKLDTLITLEEAGYKLNDALITKIMNCEVVYSNRMTSTAGIAKYFPLKIKLSRPIYKTITRQEQIKTFIHELLHIFAYLYYGTSQGHNKKWKSLMTACNLKPDRCHSYKVKRRKINKNYIIICNDCHYSQDCTARRYNRQNNEGVRYQCPYCKHPMIVFKKSDIYWRD